MVLFNDIIMISSMAMKPLSLEGFPLKLHFIVPLATHNIIYERFFFDPLFKNSFSWEYLKRFYSPLVLKIDDYTAIYIYSMQSLKKSILRFE